MKKTHYCLDSNVLIDAWDRTYSEAMCPGYWDLLKHLGKKHEGILYTTRQIIDEIKESDNLKKLVSDNLNHEIAKDDRFTGCFEKVTKKFNDIKGSNPINEKKDASGADLSLVALAEFLKDRLKTPIEAESDVKIKVVTNEVATQKQKDTKTVKLPDVCEKMRIECISGYQYLEEVSEQYGYKLCLAKAEEHNLPS